jgi:hypothetical protein
LFLYIVRLVNVCICCICIYQVVRSLTQKTTYMYMVFILIGFFLLQVPCWVCLHLPGSVLHHQLWPPHQTGAVSVCCAVYTVTSRTVRHLQENKQGKLSLYTYCHNHNHTAISVITNNLVVCESMSSESVAKACTQMWLRRPKASYVTELWIHCNIWSRILSLIPITMVDCNSRPYIGIFTYSTL